MRIAINVEQLLYRAPGGIGRYTAKLVTLLPLQFPDDEVVPFTARHRAAEIDRAWARAAQGSAAPPPPVVLPLPRPLLYDSWHLTRLPRLGWSSSRLARCGLVHAPSLAVPPAGRAKLVVNIHDVAPLLFPETFPRRGRWFHAQGLRAARRFADVIITGTHAAAAELTEVAAIGPDRIRVIANGVDQRLAAAGEVADARDRHDLAGPRYVLWVGSLEPRKDVGTLVAAFARLPVAAAEGVRLVLVGPSGWLDGSLIDPEDRRRLGDRLRFLGRVADADLAALYAGAAVFAFPSRHEGFGLPVLEAMVQGTPVVCSDIPALAEVAGGAACLVPPGDVDAWAAALGEVLTDADEVGHLQRAGRERAASFRWHHTVEATHDIYAELAG